MDSNDFDIIAKDAVILGLQDLEKDIEQMLRPSREEVRQAAQKFLKSYEDSQKKYNQLLKQAGRKKSSHLKQWAELEVARTDFDNFQNSINAYYGQLMKIMYVYMDPSTGAITLSVEDNTTELLQINKNYKSVQYHLDSIKNIFKMDDYDSTLLDATQQSIYARWQIAKSHTKKSQWLPILWKINNKWAGAKVNNLGTIAEAYVNFYISKYNFSSYLEQNVSTYILHPQLGAAAVDNASGFLIGDSSALNGKIQFAVKKDLASPMQMKKVADEVRKVIDSEDFLEQIAYRFVEEEKEKAIRNQVKPLEKELNKTYDGLISDIEKIID